MLSSLAIALAVVASKQGEPDWSNSDFMYMARFVAGYRTDPGTWAQEAAFGLRMGMGPGDVAARIPKAQTTIPDSGVKEGQAATYVDKVGNLNAQVFLRYLRGRLYAIEVGPSIYRILSKKQGFSMEAMERAQKEEWVWTRDVIGTLTSELGKPACAPSERTIGRFCFKVAPLPGCAFKDREKADKLFRWVWRVGRTETVLTGRGWLEYRDIEAMPRVARAKQAASRERAAREARQKAADRAKITGTQTEETVLVPEAESRAELDEQATEEPWPLECYADDDEPSKDQRTQASSWSSVGWDRYRWGMGPADVKDLFPPLDEKSIYWDSGTLEPASYLLIGTKVLEAPSASRFRFVDGRLFSIEHQPNCVGFGEKAGVDCVRWSKKVEATFNKRCGDGRCTRDGKYIECSWACGDTEHASLRRYNAGEFQSVSLTYANPANFPKKASSASVRISTPEKSWSAQGWYGFRYAMGPADVQRRLSAPAGEFRATRQMACVISKENANELDCTLERDFHAMSVAGLKPTLSFRFVDSRMYSVSLTFPKGLENPEFDQATDRLRSLLLEKYGKPRQELGEKETTPRNISMHWDSDDLSITFYAMMTTRGAEMFISYFAGGTYRQLKRDGHGNTDGAKL